MRQVTSQIMFTMMTMMVMMVVMMMMELMMTMVCMISNIDMIFQETDGVLLESYLIYEPDHQVDIICLLLLQCLCCVCLPVWYQSPT